MRSRSEDALELKGINFSSYDRNQNWRNSMVSRNQLLMILAICIVSVVGVNCQEIKYDSIPGTDFSKYKKYKWQRAEKANYSDASVDDMMTRAIDAELSAKGFVRTNGDDADLY